MGEGKLKIHLVYDEYFDVAGSFSDQRDIDEVGAKLNSGEWTAYGIYVTVGGKKIGDSIWGTVADSGYIGEYDSPEEIGNEYLRETAKDILDETRESVHLEVWYFVAQNNLGTAQHEALIAMDKNRAPAVKLYNNVNEAMQVWKDAGGVDAQGAETSVFETTFQVRRISVGRPGPNASRYVTESELA